MTKHVSAEERRHQVGEALMHVVADNGLAATTLRQVADTAGVSVGLVQRYFASKKELIHFGFEHVYGRTRQRVEAVPITTPVRGIVVGLAEALLPLTEERVRESRVWLAFLHWSVNDPDLATIHHRSASELREGLRDAIAGAQRTGEVSESSDPELEALALMTYIDGLTVEAVTTGDMYPPATVRTLLDAYLDRVFVTAPDGPGAPGDPGDFR